MTSRDPELRAVELAIRDLTDEGLVAALSWASEQGILNAYETALGKGLRRQWSWRGDLSWKQRRAARRALEKMAARAHREKRLRALADQVLSTASAAARSGGGG